LTSNAYGTASELARGIHAVLTNVQEGAEVLVEQDSLPVAFIRSPFPQARLLSECITIAEARVAHLTLDSGFSKDVEEGIAIRSQPWNPPSWE
jgi:hypothetical protein